MTLLKKKVDKYYYQAQLFLLFLIELKIMLPLD